MVCVEAASTVDRIKIAVRNFLVDCSFEIARSRHVAADSAP